MITIINPFTYRKIALSLVCFLWGLSQAVYAQSQSVTQLFEGLEQYSIEEVELVLEERLEEWLLRFKDKPALLAASSGSLLNALEGQGYFKAATFLSERLLGNDRCDFDSRLQKKLDHYKNIQEGKKAPQLSFNAPGSLQLNFLEQQETEKQLLVFWSSSCPHCLDALPQLARLQKKLAEQDISLLSISLDREEATFRKTASAYPWVHYSDFQGWDSPAVKAYHVFATPSFFLVNAKGVLEKEFISVEQIRDFSTSPPYGRQATTFVHFDRSGEIFRSRDFSTAPAYGRLRSK